jgi:hypothetical protein
MTEPTIDRIDGDFDDEPTDDDLVAIERPRFDDLESIKVEVDEQGGVIRIISVRARRPPIDHTLTADEWQAMDDQTHAARLADEWRDVRRRPRNYDPYEDRRRPAEAA